MIRPAAAIHVLVLVLAGCGRRHGLSVDAGRASRPGPDAADDEPAGRRAPGGPGSGAEPEAAIDAPAVEAAVAAADTAMARDAAAVARDVVTGDAPSAEDAARDAALARDAAADAPPDSAPPPDAPPPVPGFRPVLPLSGVQVTTNRPTFRWTDVGVGDYYVVDICPDVRCAKPITTYYTGLGDYAPDDPLPPGVAFWRAGVRMGTTTSYAAVWEVFVPERPTGHDAGGLARVDLDRDGRADLAMAGAGGAVYVHAGVAGGVAAAPATLAAPARALAYGSDVDGDGLGDLLVARDDGVAVYLGGATLAARTLPGSGTSSIAGVGDVNSDGYGDVLVGSADTGTALLYLGAPGGPAAVATGAGLKGARVGAVGDVDGDGYADAVTCGPGMGARLAMGGPGGLKPGPTLADPRSSNLVTFGHACRGAGDVNGDGLADVLVTATDGYLRVFVYHGATGAIAAPAASLTLGSAMGHGGDDIDAGWAGDVNRDGYADVVVAAPDGVRLYLGGPSGLTTTPATMLAIDARTAVPVGDVNGDRFGDVAVGPSACDGEVRIYAGGPTGLAAVPVQRLPNTDTPCRGQLAAR